MGTRAPARRPARPRRTASRAGRRPARPRAIRPRGVTPVVVALVPAPASERAGARRQWPCPCPGPVLPVLPVLLAEVVVVVVVVVAAVDTPSAFASAFTSENKSDDSASVIDPFCTSLLMVPIIESTAWVAWLVSPAAEADRAWLRSLRNDLAAPEEIEPLFWPVWMSASRAAPAEPAVADVVVVVGVVVVVVGAVVVVVEEVAGGVFLWPTPLSAHADRPAATRTEAAITAHKSQLGLRRGPRSSGAGGGGAAAGTTSVRPGPPPSVWARCASATRVPAAGGPPATGTATVSSAARSHGSSNGSADN